MATNPPSATSFSNTPQAANDLFLLNEDTVSLAGGNILTLDVMANDAGGNAKQLWSLDDTALFANLKLADTSGAWETTAGGNQMRIVNGKVELNLSSALSPYGGSVQGLGAGEKITDSFYYTIRLANGTLSLAKADFTITGQNDAPVITSTARSVAFTEDSPAFSAVGRITATDADTNDRLSFSGNVSDSFGTFTVNASGVWSFDLKTSGSAVQSLAKGEVKTLTYPVTVSDGNGGTATQDVTITITGTNDAPTISAHSTASGSTGEDDTALASGQIIASDIDNGAILTYSAATRTSGAADFGTFDIANDGKWTFTLANGNAAVQSLAEGQVKTIIYTVTVTDQHGATATRMVTVTVTGTNDAPVITAADTTATLPEDGTATATGQITAADVDTGATLSYSATAQTEGSADYGSFSVDNSGKWTFALSNGADAVQTLAEGTSVELTYTVTVKDDKGATATQDVTVTITGTNDAPVITAADTAANVAEDGTATATGQITATDVDTGATLTYSAEASNAGHADYGSFSVDGNGGWSFALSNNSAAVQSIAEGKSVELTYTVTVTDEHGATATQDVKVTITGTNDAPVITSSAQTGAVAEDGTLTASGTVTATDVDTGATQSFSGSATGTYGAFAVDAATGQWTYTLDNAAHQNLAQGETKTETFTVTVKDDKGATATQDVKVTITGTNDAPVITSSAQAGAVAEDGTLTASGTVTATDVDTGATQSFSGNATGTYGAFAVDAATGKWTYTLDNAAHQNLAQGDTKTETFTVTVKDEHGATATQDVKVTITGTNDAPVITSSAQTGAVAEDGTLTATGTVTATDVDTGATQSFSGNATGTYGAFAVDAATGQWTYSLDNAAHQNLAQGETQTETFTVTVKDDKGATATQDVTVTITGTNDKPVFTAAAPTVSMTEDQLSVSGQVQATDVDGDAVTYGLSGMPVADKFSSISVSNNGAWSYQVNPSSVQSLHAGETDVETFNIVAYDTNGGAVIQTVTVNITGVNDAAAIGGVSTGSVTEDGTLTANGKVTVTDVDHDEAAFRAPTSLTGTYGTFTFNTANGEWTYALNNASTAVQALNTGASLQDKLTVSSLDGTATKDIVVTINGADEVSQTPSTLGAVDTTNQDPNDPNGSGFPETPNNFGNNIKGTSSADNISALGGDDTVFARNGADTVDGGPGFDTLYGGAGNDSLIGSGDGDSLYGGSNNDALNGGSGNDSLIGGFGADTLTGSSGDDRFIFLSTSDRGDSITDFKTSGTDKIDVSAIDVNAIAAGDQAFTWGGTSKTANGLWYVADASTSTVYADTDGNTDTAELWFTVNGTSFTASDFIL
ncbi:beta strand repeat-containing protein [Paragemmobacter straminiformis]|uniref:Tandem-95 repeat protein n=1 Tax=Paragemmobacter straminiformis TaxID=2045119 RepID=A0A842IAM4_9RHOB|nr:VCBS domain-containing protein [Gemmobacter straminiformis]MBC2836397.1 tandem-95 repeat protein [Gemmobacter straminiformis]